MMKRLATLLAVALIAMPFFGLAQSRSYNESGFNSISFGVPGTLTVIQGDTYSIELSGDEDDLEKIVVEVRGEDLVIKTRNNSWSRMGRVTGTVTLPEISGLALSGSGTLKSSGTLSVGDVSLAVSGSGDMDLDMNADDVTIAISGSGELEVAGECRDISIAISGSGTLDADEFAAQDANVAISGSGEAFVDVNGDLMARISGSGDVFYVGDPRSVDSKVSGSGRIQKRN